MSPEIEAAARAHALRDYPREACGVVVGGAYVPMENVSKEPERSFEIAGNPPGVEAVLHSHPYEATEDRAADLSAHACPSAWDMQAQLDSAVPWGVIATDGKTASAVVWWGDQLPLAPLLGRKFVHGVSDCYALVRDYYRQELGKVLDEMPRDHAWWYKPGVNLLSRANFLAHGWEEVDASGLTPGDVVLGSVLAKVTNHCAIYLGQGLILHHLYGRASRRDPLGPWERYVRHYLRYTR